MVLGCKGQNIKYDIQKRGRHGTVIYIERYILWGNVYFLGFMRFSPYDLVSHGCVEICCILYSMTNHLLVQCLCNFGGSGILLRVYFDLIV